MKEVLHVSSECYPAAKAGGMGDVLGALPAYLPEHGINASVIIPKYKTQWFLNQKFKTLTTGTFSCGNQKQKFTVQQLDSSDQAFPLYCIDLPGLFDRDSIYLAEDGHGFKDEPKRNIAFQTAILEWLKDSPSKFDLLHVHDHMTGLIPFFLKYSPRYTKLKGIPSVLSIHNGAYRGEFVWEEVKSFLPAYDEQHGGVMDWDGKLNSLATALKCTWAVNTVSPSYMLELVKDSDTLTPLYESELHKCLGILNGIDADLWDPTKDQFLDHHLHGSRAQDWKKFKSANKAFLLEKFKLKSRRPLIGFIGRFANQKGADLLMKAIDKSINQNLKFDAVILGSGDSNLEEEALRLMKENPGTVGAEIAYNEKLARQIYAGCDFLIMPSRFEPCGLNQLYAMRYGTIPIVSHVGGLKDTVIDITKDGQGLVIKELNEKGLVDAISRSIDLYRNKKALSKLIGQITKLDYSWSNSAKDYAKLYFSTLN